MTTSNPDNLAPILCAHLIGSVDERLVHLLDSLDPQWFLADRVRVRQPETRILAFERIPPNAHQNLGFIRKHENRGHAVEVKPGGMVNVDLTILK
jgi:hypothetical protein